MKLWVWRGESWSKSFHREANPAGTLSNTTEQHKHLFIWRISGYKGHLTVLSDMVVLMADGICNCVCVCVYWSVWYEWMDFLNRAWSAGGLLFCGLWIVIIQHADADYNTKTKEELRTQSDFSWQCSKHWLIKMYRKKKKDSAVCYRKQHENNLCANHHYSYLMWVV